MLDAVKRIPINAKITARGSAPPASGAPKGIDAAIAAPGAMEQMDWNTTSRNPIALPSNLSTDLLITLLFHSRFFPLGISQGISLKA